MQLFQGDMYKLLQLACQLTYQYFISLQGHVLST